MSLNQQLHCSINTLEPNFFITNINNAYAKRREREAEESNKYIDINADYFQLIQ